MNEQQALVSSNIEEHGWHCIVVAPKPDETFEEFVYTIGLHERFNHPEIMIFGLPRDAARGILAECVSLVESGVRLPVEEPVREVLDGDYSVVFKPVQRDKFDEFLGTAVRYYDGQKFDALVLFWPNKQHQYPWDVAEPTLQREALEII